MDGVDQRLVETCHANLPTLSPSRLWPTSQLRAALTRLQQGGGYEPERCPAMENLCVYNSTLTTHTALGMMTKHMKHMKQTHPLGSISQQDGLEQWQGRCLYLGETGRYSLLFISRGSHIICIVLEYVYVKAKCVVKTKSSNNLLNINSLGDIFSCNRV